MIQNIKYLVRLSIAVAICGLFAACSIPKQLDLTTVPGLGNSRCAQLLNSANIFSTNVSKDYSWWINLYRKNETVPPAPSLHNAFRINPGTQLTIDSVKTQWLFEVGDKLTVRGSIAVIDGITREFIAVVHSSNELDAKLFVTEVFAPCR